MATDSRFRRAVSLTPKTLRFYFEDECIEAKEGDSVAAALLLAGIEYTRTTPVSKARRAPYCMMGTCFECLVAIDDAQNLQACMVRVKDGMRVKRMRGARSAANIQATDDAR